MLLFQTLILFSPIFGTKFHFSYCSCNSLSARLKKYLCLLFCFSPSTFAVSSVYIINYRYLFLLTWIKQLDFHFEFFLVVLWLTMFYTRFSSFIWSLSRLQYSRLYVIEFDLTHIVLPDPDPHLGLPTWIWDRVRLFFTGMVQFVVDYIKNFLGIKFAAVLEYPWNLPVTIVLAWL